MVAVTIACDTWTAVAKVEAKQARLMGNEDVAVAEMIASALRMHGGNLHSVWTVVALVIANLNEGGPGVGNHPDDNHQVMVLARAAGDLLHAIDADVKR